MGLWEHYLRPIFAREWPELGDGWKDLVRGGRDEAEASALDFSVPETPGLESLGAEEPSPPAPSEPSPPEPSAVEAVAPESDLESERVVERGARVAEIKIRNFKAVESLELELPTSGVELLPRYGSDDEKLSAIDWIALLGENGSGKSCLLQAIGLGLAGDRLDALVVEAGLEWKKMLRRGTRQGRIFLRFTGGTTVDLRFNAKRHWWVGGAPRMANFVRGYGATRLLEGDRTTGDAALENASGENGDEGGAGPGVGDHVRLANLFDPRAPVLDAERWLLDLARRDTGDFHAAALTLSGFLGADDARLPAGDGASATRTPLITRDAERDEVLVGGDPLSYVSDGYRALVALVCDVMAGLGVGLSDMRNATGIVLIDEIGAHLHPRWKMEITGRLRREFPRLQFLVSTHEPLCLRGLFAREVIRVRKVRPERAPGGPPVLGRVSLEVVERSPSDYRVDQLLTSEFFGLDTTIDPDLDRRFQVYYRLLAMTPEERARKLPGDPERSYDDELARLRAELRRLSKPVLGSTRRDQLVYEAIDEFLAETESDPGLRERRRRETLDKIKDIWAPPDFSNRARRERR